MIKSINNLKKQEKDNFNIPKSIQQVIPIQRIWTDGIFLVGKNKYSQTFKFSDINYAVASKEDKEAMFLEYGELLNSFDSGAPVYIPTTSSSGATLAGVLRGGQPNTDYTMIFTKEDQIAAAIGYSRY